MGAVLSYSIFSSIILMLLYPAYKISMSGENQHACNRAVLWLIYAVTLLSQPLLGNFIGNISRLLSAATATGVTIQSPLATAVADIPTLAGESSQPLWLTLILWGYIVGVVIMLGLTLATILRLTSIVARGEEVRRYADGKIVLVTPAADNIAPFSWYRYVVMNRRDWDECGEMILTHELQHLDRHHWIDLVAAQAVIIIQWFNPAAWLMREELKTVHEYQADCAVIDSGVAIRDYQMLLIKKAVGARFPSLANSLNHSKLKKRITMMYNPKSSVARRMRGLTLVPAFCAALAVTNIDAVASVITETSSAAAVSTSFAPDKGSEKSHVGQTTVGQSAAKPDSRLPQFPGGEKALLSFLAENVRYPQSAYDAKIQGNVIVKFIIEADGSIGDVEVIRKVNEALDAEAVRVIKSLPKFTPAIIDGTPAAVPYVIPVNFRLK